MFRKSRLLGQSAVGARFRSQGGGAAGEVADGVSLWLCFHGAAHSDLP